MLFKVGRQFSSNVPHKTGDVVDIDGPHVRKLIEQRYLIPLSATESPTAVPAPAATEVTVAVKRGRGRPKKEVLTAPTSVAATE